MNKKHVCPNGCNANFYTIAHIAEEWEVDGKGKLINVIGGCIEVINQPHDDNIWTCSVCGAEAKIEEE